MTRPDHHPAPESATATSEPRGAGAHTPGPWRVEMTIYEHMAAEIVARKGLAQVWEGPNAWADARLMAAAPDLYNALADTLRMLEAAHHSLGMDHNGNKRVIRARAALASARPTS